MIFVGFWMFYYSGNWLQLLTWSFLSKKKNLGNPKLNRNSRIYFLSLPKNMFLARKLISRNIVFVFCFLLSSHKMIPEEEINQSLKAMQQNENKDRKRIVRKTTEAKTDKMLNNKKRRKRYQIYKKITHNKQIRCSKK